ncbi:MAG: tRNA lysidine(34) synthetase TilS, partial [Burkholderiales bacterium]|nr:tRNA lysidine(34) synthetase TilS [Burkholderiales bacterium]
VERLEAELPGAHAARWPAPGTELRLYRGLLGAAAVDARRGGSDAAAEEGTDAVAEEAADQGAGAAAAPAPGGDRQRAPAALTLDLGRPGRHPVPAWRGHFEVAPVAQGGVAPALLCALEARLRAGGERFRLAPRASPRSLKKQFQALGIPVEDREGPLLYAGARLLYVPGLGIDAALQAPAGMPQLGLRWVGAGGTGQRQPRG